MPKLDKNAIKKFNSYMENKYYYRQDKDNIFPVGITDTEFVLFITHIFLGEKWYCVNPITHNQVNEEVICSILDKFDKKWREY